MWVLGLLAGCSGGLNNDAPFEDGLNPDNSGVVPSGSSPMGGSSSALPGQPTTTAGASATPTSAAGGSASAMTSASAPSVAPPPPTECLTPTPGRAPLRRLTSFEYSNTVEALLGDTTTAGSRLPAELLGNGFGNDADSQPSSAFLIEQYGTIAADLVATAFESTAVINKYDACVLGTPQDEASCVRGFLTKFGEAAYRRPLDAGELDLLVGLQQSLREHGDFKSSVTGTVETMLQTPEFLYRVEFGEAAANGLRRPSGYEMANRLSYFLWGSPPDAALVAAAASGKLNDAAGVAEQAARLIDDPKARRVTQFFFDSYLPINALNDQSREPEMYPTFNGRIGSLMHEETSTFLEHEIFEGTGTWDSILTAPFTFVNEELAGYYGISGVEGEEFRKVDLDTTKRLGLLTQGALMTGTTVSNYTNPVRRGGFLLSHILCIEVPLPPAELLARAKPPEPYTGKTGRERYTIHSQDTECASCHALLDPPGFGLENFDAVGLWRDTENDVTIDASGSAVGIGAFSGPVELIQRIAESTMTHACFAKQWQTFAYGRELHTVTTPDQAADPADVCNANKLSQAFEASGHNVKQLLLDLTQTDAFLYLGEGDSH
jgi:Protein of unknown function (DUF1592)/Protein of unknown function (DUF1588)/Protein of unknown function (DUF1595)/Protein of unknown function (DUF1587)/Protein of unknown function (DUF1585)